MHRVELKAALRHQKGRRLPQVPNAPCGVERPSYQKQVEACSLVPNAPCGVERMFVIRIVSSLTLFLMYRVELKGG